VSESGTRTSALVDLVASRIGQAGGRGGTTLSAVVAVLLSLGMLVIRVHDGAGAFFDGIVARAVTVHLVLAALPLSLAVARMGRTWPGEAGLLGLTRQAGFSDDDVAALVPAAAMRVAGRRCALVCAPVALLAVVVTMPEQALAGRRLLVATLLVLLGVLASAGLVGGAAVLARLTRTRATLSLFAVLVVPWAIAMVVPVVPPFASLPGVYGEIRDRILASADAK
jgi:hypothetical protein